MDVLFLFFNTKAVSYPIIQSSYQLSSYSKQLPVIQSSYQLFKAVTSYIMRSYQNILITREFPFFFSLLNDEIKEKTE